MRIAISILFFLPFFPALSQHDGARNSVKLIAEGKFEKVNETLRKKKPFAGDAESRFVEMLALLAQDKFEEAFEKAKAAFEAGLPADRFLAGPRELLGKVDGHPAFADWIKKLPAPKVIHGPMLGNITADSASIWIRTPRADSVTISIADPSGAEKTETVETTADTDFTGVITFDNLKPNTTYQYAVADSTAKGQFTTTPPSQSPGKFSVAFGGGAGYVPEWEKMWDTIGSFKPRALLMLGDNIYIDQPEHTLTQYYCYYRRQSRPEWKRLVASTAIYSIWDDHDFGTNDCVPGPLIDEPTWKRPVWNIFRQNWVNPGYGGGEKQPGCWYDFEIADVHFIMLDGRYYRDRKGGTMLGPAQKDWLEKTLTNSRGTFKVLVSPVPFTPGIKPGSRDPWDGYPEEREWIFSLIEKENIKGVYLVSADRHRTDLRAIARPNGYTLYEFESSRLTNHHTHKVVQTEGLIWGYNKTCSFGLMEFDTTKDDPEVTFRCITIDGEETNRHVLQQSMLKQ